jgi:hypothetical protein
VRTDGDPPRDRDAIFEPRSRADGDLRADDAKRADEYIVGERGRRIDAGMGGNDGHWRTLDVTEIVRELLRAKSQIPKCKSQTIFNTKISKKVCFHVECRSLPRFGICLLEFDCDL